MKKIKLHWQILIGMVIGALAGILINELNLQTEIVGWIKPFGTIFIRLITMIAVPLVLASLIVGSSSMKDIRQFSRIGARALFIFLFTTGLAVTIGLTLANLFEPGNAITGQMKEQLSEKYSSTVSEKVANVEVNMVDELVNIVPTNPFFSLSTRRGEMLQVVFFAIFLGITLSMLPKEKSTPVIQFFDGLNQALIRIIELVMKIAPYGVFALIFAVVADFGFEILRPLGSYVFVVVLGLMVQMFVVYGGMLKALTRVPVGKFFKSMTEVQFVAFSTSSSAATLPVTMNVAEKKIGVREEVASFVLPVGATLNMDGTALYQGVAAVFIAQVYGIELNMVQQLTIVLTATLASIGTAAVPGVGMVMLVMILQTLHIPVEGIALIFGVDRILDMLRTMTNVTGDVAVATIIATKEDMMNPMSDNGNGDT